MRIEKPRLSPATCRLFYEIVVYVRRYGRNDSIWQNAASDVMDGNRDNRDPEVRELKRKQIIHGIAGSWELTAWGREIVQRAPFVPEYSI